MGIVAGPGMAESPCSFMIRECCRPAPGRSLTANGARPESLGLLVTWVLAANVPTPDTSGWRIYPVC